MATADLAATISPLPCLLFFIIPHLLNLKFVGHTPHFPSRNVPVLFRMLRTPPHVNPNLLAGPLCMFNFVLPGTLS